MIQFGFSFDFQQPIATIIHQVQLAEKSGFDFVLVPDCVPYPNCYDSFVLQAHLAANTKHIRIGAGIVNPFNRHPLMIAYAVNSLNEASNGRAFVTLGAGSRMSLDAMGLFPQHRPIRSLMEATEIISQIQTGSPLTYTGKIFTVTNAQLAPIPSPPFPVLLSGRGPQMLQLMGKVGNGGFALVPCEAADTTMQIIKQGAQKAKRDLHNHPYGIWLASYLSPTPPKEYDLSFKLHVFFALAQSPDEINQQVGISPQETATMRQAFAKKGYDGIGDLVTDRIIEKYAFVGREDHIIERIHTAIKAGFTRFVFSEPHGKTTEDGVRRIVENIIPHFKEPTTTE